MLSGDDLIDFKELRPANIVADLVVYLQQEFLKFPGSSEFMDILEKKKNENQHSLAFCVYMTNKCNSKYYFARENSQLGNSVVDIGVYKGSVLIFTIEAKILPTPKGSIKKPRFTHEYVYGIGAGIQRFKEGKHGVDNLNNTLSESGLIGFFKEENEEYWFNQINTWVKETNWGTEEELYPIVPAKYDFLLSKHTRVGSRLLSLYHFLIAVV